MQNLSQAKSHRPQVVQPAIFERSNNMRMTIDIWDIIPQGKARAVSYAELIDMTRITRREVRRHLADACKQKHRDGVLIRSTDGGFYKTTDRDEIRAYRHQIISRIKAHVDEVKAIDEFLVGEYDYYTLIDDLVKESEKDDKRI